MNYHLAHSEQERAIEILNTAIKAVPNSAGLHYQLGCLNAEADDTMEAINQFQQSYNLEPKNLEYTRALTKSCRGPAGWKKPKKFWPGQSRPSPSIRTCCEPTVRCWSDRTRNRSAGTLPGAHRPASHRRGTLQRILRLVLEDLTGGIGVVVARENPVYALVMYTRDALETAVENCPSSRMLQLFLAEVLAKLSDREDSRAMFAELSEYAFELPEDLRWRVNYGLGLTSGEMGEYDVALAALQEAANQNPSHFQIHQQLAEAYLRANLGQSAMQAAQQALSIDPKDPDNLVWYANSAPARMNCPKPSAPWMRS